MEFAHTDLKDVKDFLTREQKEGNLFVAYPGDQPIYFKFDLHPFKSSFDAQAYIDRTSTDGYSFTYSPIREMQQELDKAIDRRNVQGLIYHSPIVEKLYDEKAEQVVDTLLKGQAAEVNIQESVRVKDHVHEFAVVGNTHTGMIWESGYTNWIVSKHTDYADALKALQQSVEGDLQKPQHDRANYNVVGKFDGVKLSLDPDGSPDYGTGVLMNMAYAKYDPKSDARVYDVQQVIGLEDKAAKNVPHYLTLDQDKMTLQLHEQKPMVELDKGNDRDKAGVIDFTKPKDELSR